MRDNEVSEKAVWEGSITPDSDTPSFASQMQSQPQMMFCYKCNQVIPGDSKFCPYCQTELYVIYPKCGAKYSSQYPSCNQCGTNRLEYIETLRREKERIKAEIQEKRLRQKKLEQERQEQERQEQERQEQIINTKEYQSIYSILEESLDRLDKKYLISFPLSFIFLTFSFCVYYLVEEPVILLFGCFLFVAGLIWFIKLHICSTDAEQREQYIMQYIKKNNCDYNKDMMNYVLNKMRDSSNIVTHDELSKWCIEAYIKVSSL